MLQRYLELDMDITVYTVGRSNAYYAPLWRLLSSSRTAVPCLMIKLKDLFMTYVTLTRRRPSRNPARFFRVNEKMLLPFAYTRARCSAHGLIREYSCRQERDAERQQQAY
eukprot:934167-Pleurochrysis_carterae.AAC.1